MLALIGGDEKKGKAACVVNATVQGLVSLVKAKDSGTRFIQGSCALRRLSAAVGLIP